MQIVVTVRRRYAAEGCTKHKGSNLASQFSNFVKHHRTLGDQTTTSASEQPGICGV